MKTEEAALFEWAKDHTRLPPPTWKHVVLLHQIARALGWSSARVRGVDDMLKPRRLAGSRTRVYDAERALVFIRWVDATRAFYAVRDRESSRLRRRSRGQQLADATL